LEDYLSEEAYFHKSRIPLGCSETGLFTGRAMTKSTVVLKIERFHDNEDLEYRVPSKVERLDILKHIVEYYTLVALYYDNNKEFILSTLLGVDEQGMWLDIAQFPEANEAILRSNKITLVSEHRAAKVQFIVQDIRSDLFENGEAFYCEIPDHLLRIQRRGIFRIKTPISNPITCLIPITSDNADKNIAPTLMREVVITDIGLEGVGLRCEEHETDLLKGKTFHDCQISLPDIGTFTASITIKSDNTFVARDNVVQRHLGCAFVEADNHMNAMLQRYVYRLEREAKDSADIEKEVKERKTKEREARKYFKG
jgi:c-di-GMP-binding flagellar brake protein YcgR